MFMHNLIPAIVHGILLAFGLIVPLGIQNLFVFNQGALQPTLLKALPSVITAALCDTLLIILAVLGVSLLLLELAWLKLSIFIVGFFFLLYMGYVTWNQASQNRFENKKPLSAKMQIVFSASVSLLNPHAILDTIAIIGTNSVQYDVQAKIAYTGSCIIVSWIWFYGLAFAGSKLHTFDKNNTWMKNINKIAAIIIWVIACYIGFQILSITYPGSR